MVFRKNRKVKNKTLSARVKVKRSSRPAHPDITIPPAKTSASSSKKIKSLLLGQVMSKDELAAIAHDWQSTFDASSDGIWLLDKDQKVVRANRMAEKMFGQNSKSCIGRHCYEIVHGTKEPIPDCPVGRARTSLHRESMELQIGGRWYLIIADPILDQAGSFSRMVHVVSDITERKRVEAALRMKNLVFDASISANSIADESGVITEVNNSFLKAWGYASKNEVVGRPIGSFLKNQDEAVEIVTALNQNAQWEGDYTAKRKDGSFFTAHGLASVIRNDKGDIIGYQSSVIDVTERKHIELVLAESQAMLAETESIGKVGGWSFNIDTMVQTWTDEVYRIHEAELGLNPTVQEGINYYTKASRPIIEKAVQRAIELGEGFDLELEIITAKGNTRAVHAIGRADLKNRRVYGFLQDITERKKVADALRRKEEQLNETGRIAKVGGWDLNIQTNQLTWTEETKRIHEVALDYNPTVETAIGFYHPESRQIIQALVQRAIETGQAFDAKLRVLTASGREIWVRAQGVSERSNGKIVRISGAFQDITELVNENQQRVEAQKEAQNYLQRLQIATRAARIGIWDWNLVDNILIWDDMICEIYGVPSGFFKGGAEEWSEHIHPDDRSRVLDELQAGLRGEREYAPEFRIIWPDGSIHYIKANSQVFRGENEKPVRMVGTNIDITERKKSEEAIVRSEIRFRTLATIAPIGIYITTPEGDCLFANDAWCAIAGLSLEEALGKGWIKGLHPDDRGLVFENWNRMVESKGHWGMEYRFKDRAGKVTTVYGFATPQYDESGRIVGYIGVNVDVTERKKAEDEIRKLNAELELRVSRRTAQLEAANKELESFSYSVSHDLRAPLRGIDGWSQALKEDYEGKLDEQAQTYIGRIRAETQRMGQLIDALLQLSRTARATVSIRNVDLSTLAADIALRLKERQNERQVEFVIQTGINAHGDPNLLEVVLTNLLGNAFKFTGKCEKATIEFGEKSKEQSAEGMAHGVGQGEAKEEKVYFVRDNGAGFDMAYSKKLFGAFQRMHRTSEFPGTGIGLATVQRIILQHGGRIWAEAEVDKGATFYFTLGGNK